MTYSSLGGKAYGTGGKGGDGTITVGSIETGIFLSL